MRFLLNSYGWIKHYGRTGLWLEIPIGLHFNVNRQPQANFCQMWYLGFFWTARKCLQTPAQRMAGCRILALQDNAALERFTESE
jgi:hypothetical protein